MAKSIRSKWKRKMRAIKRVRYDQKATEKLKEILAVAQQKEEEEAAKKDSDMQDGEPSESMEMSKERINSKTLKDSKNQFPGWLTKKQKKRVTISSKRHKKKSLGKNKSLPVVWKQAIS